MTTLSRRHIDCVPGDILVTIILVWSCLMELGGSWSRLCITNHAKSGYRTMRTWWVGISVPVLELLDDKLEYLSIYLGICVTYVHSLLTGKGCKAPATTRLKSPINGKVKKRRLILQLSPQKQENRKRTVLERRNDFRKSMP